MGAVIADVAVAEGVPPPPVVVKTVLLERQHRHRTDPEVVVHAGWRLRRLLVSDVFPALDVPGLGHENVADRPLPQEPDGIGDQGIRAALGPVLNDHAVAAGGLEQEASLPEVVAAGLFHVDVLTSVAGQDRCRGVPVVRCGDDHGVDRLVVENPPQVGDGLAGPEFGAGRISPLLVGIAHIGDSDAGHGRDRFGNAPALAPAADQRHHDVVVGSGMRGGRRHRKARRAGPLDERSAAGHHALSSRINAMSPSLNRPRRTDHQHILRLRATDAPCMNVRTILESAA